MKAGQSLFSLFAHSPAHTTRGSRLEYRTRFLAAPPAGILEQKRDCSQSTSLIFERTSSGGKGQEEPAEHHRTPL